jgi:hypothetical protein
LGEDLDGMRRRVMEVEEAAGLMPLIGTLQADGLAQIGAIKISLTVSQLERDGKLGRGF